VSRWVSRWAGGRVAERKDGRLVWHLDQRRRGVRYTFALDVESERRAMAELALFDRDPVAYAKARDLRQASLVTVDADHVEAFDRHLRDKGDSLLYRRDAVAYLSAWIVALRGRPLASLTLADLHRVLDDEVTARKHRIIALKSYCGWLRERGYLAREDDPTLDLRVPPHVPERSVRAKGFTLAHVEAVYSRLAPQEARDILAVRARTGMHESELARIIRGEAVIREVWLDCGIAAVVRFSHKSGRMHLQSVDAATLGALRRLREAWAARVAAGERLPAHTVDNNRLRRQLAAASRAAGVEALRPGELRHSFVTWREHGRLVRAVEGGVALADVSEIIGHQSTRTTSRYYDGLDAPPLMVLPLRLEHVDDPPHPKPPAGQGGGPPAETGDDGAAG